jgi:hypothetical protein
MKSKPEQSELDKERKKIAEVFDLPMAELNRIDAQLLPMQVIKKEQKRFWKKVILPMVKKVAKEHIELVEKIIKIYE